MPTAISSVFLVLISLANLAVERANISFVSETRQKYISRELRDETVIAVKEAIPVLGGTDGATNGDIGMENATAMHKSTVNDKESSQAKVNEIEFSHYLGLSPRAARLLPLRKL